MNELYYAELAKAQKQINEVLKSDDYDEIVRITELLEDCIDLIQTISIVLERATFLDAYIKIGDYADKASIGEISDIFQIYINDVEIAKLTSDDEISDDKLLKRFTAKCVEKKRDPITMFSMLLAITACMSLKYKEFFAIRYERLVGMLPDYIQKDYRKKGSIDKLEKMYYTGVIMNYETLCQGEILFPKKMVGYSLVKFVDDALNEMEKGEISIFTALFPETDLVNIMGVISGTGRKKIMDCLEYEDVFRISQKVFLFSFMVEGKKGGIFSKDEIYSELYESVIPSARNAVEQIIMITGNRFKYSRVQMEDSKNEC